ncbi:MAG: helix-turn-helix domain-containing protein [Phormidesmis sp.]
MANQIQKFKQWLLEKRSFRVSWFAKDPKHKPAPEEALSNLPDEMVQKLVQSVNDLPTHPHELATIKQAVEEALEAWRHNPHVSTNSIVILGDPVSSVSRILADSMGELQADQADKLPVRMLSWVERPADVHSIKQQVKEKLGLDQDEADRASDENSENGQKETDDDQHLMIIPNLCWCFLRSADGLDGLDYLQELLPQNQKQFWVLGSGIVGWDYLKSTLKFHAYCGGTVDLPHLSGEELQSWLEPIIQRFDIFFPDTALHKRLQNSDSLLGIDIDIDHPVEALSEISQEVGATVRSSVRAVKEEILSHETPTKEEEEDSPKLDYFNRLSDISDGISVVALQLFIKSLRYREKKDIEKIDTPVDEDNPKRPEEKPEEKPNEASTERRHLIATIPKLPALPELGQNDMYLLYSLMLHGDMTVAALAKSLGDAPQVVNNQVQMLRNAGLIEQLGKVLKTNPAHYPKLRRELVRNNFVIKAP